MPHDYRQEFYHNRFEELSKSVPGFRPDISQAAIALVWLYDALDRRSQSLFSDYDLTLASFNALSILHQKGPVPLKELSTLLVRTPANITGLVDGLVKRGLVKRTTHPHDRRMKLAELLPRGRELFEEILPLHHSRLSQDLGVLDSEELATLTRLSQRVRHHLEEK